MNIEGTDVLILGGSGLVGTAVARELMQFAPARLIISGLTRAEADTAVAELKADAGLLPDTMVEAAWGDLFLPNELCERPRHEVLADATERKLLLDDLYGELTDQVLARSALGALLARTRPQIVIDCVNTATAFAYQNVFDTAARLRETSATGSVPGEMVEGMLATLYLPQLIRHVQIALEAMRRAGTGCYVKVGTAGTGGMGLNIPFTHSEERPSRMLLAKAGVAGAHSLLLYLMARTPGAPAVKEVKPTAAISWKRIAFGEVRRRGRPLMRVDATAALPLERAFDPASATYVELDDVLTGVYIDAGENGLFSLGEFEALTSLGLMEFITPEEIATDVVREIRGHPTGRDIVGALDAATSGPTYRAGVLREVALDRMAALEREHGVDAVAYEMLGPPRLSKLLFESAILARLHGSLADVAALDAAAMAAAAHALVQDDVELRSRILTIGLPILLPDETLLRGPDVKIRPDADHPVTDGRLADAGWVDLRASNWRKWSERARSMLDELHGRAGPEQGSRSDVEPGDRGVSIRPGRMASWVFRTEDRGARMKR